MRADLWRHLSGWNPDKLDGFCLLHFRTFALLCLCVCVLWVSPAYLLPLVTCHPLSLFLLSSITFTYHIFISFSFSLPLPLHLIRFRFGLVLGSTSTLTLVELLLLVLLRLGFWYSCSFPASIIPLLNLHLLLILISYLLPPSLLLFSFLSPSQSAKWTSHKHLHSYSLRRCLNFFTFGT